MPICSFGRLALAGVLLGLALPAHAETLTLPAAIERALSVHPALRADLATATAITHRIDADTLPPPLTFGAELENVAGTGAVSNIGGAETTLRLGRVLELGGKRDARAQRGRADLARHETQALGRRLDLALETTRRFIALAEAQDEWDLTGQQVDLLRATEAAVRERVARGVAAEADIAVAEIALARAELAREHAEHERASARFALSALWGDPTADDLVAATTLTELPALPDFEVLAARLPETPVMLVFARENDVLDADQSLARAATRPDLALSAGVRRFEALDDAALVFSVNLPLGLEQRAAPAMDRVAAERDAVDARREAALLEARQQLFARFQELRHAQTEVDTLVSRMIPSAERGLDLTRAGYEDARYSLLQLTQAHATLLQLRLEHLAAAARFHVLFAEIERSTAAGVQP